MRVSNKMELVEFRRKDDDGWTYADDPDARQRRSDRGIQTKLRSGANELAGGEMAETPLSLLKCQRERRRCASHSNGLDGELLRFRKRFEGFIGGRGPSLWISGNTGSASGGD